MDTITDLLQAIGIVFVVLTPPIWALLDYGARKKFGDLQIFVCVLYGLAILGGIVWLAGSFIDFLMYPDAYRTAY
jgi:hypothetical protein